MEQDAMIPFLSQPPITTSSSKIPLGCCFYREWNIPSQWDRQRRGRPPYSPLGSRFITQVDPLPLFPFPSPLSCCGWRRFPQRRQLPVSCFRKKCWVPVIVRTSVERFLFTFGSSLYFQKQQEKDTLRILLQYSESHAIPTHHVQQLVKLIRCRKCLQATVIYFNCFQTEPLRLNPFIQMHE